MDCQRCSGCMMPERRTEHRGYESHALDQTWRCVNCGNVVDAIIVRNRVHKPMPQVVVG